MLSLAVLISVFFVTNGNVSFDLKLLGLLLIPFFIEAGSFALNDYFDVETDRLNKRDRPIVKGEISESTALSISVISFFIAIIISVFYNLWVINITGFFAILSILYDWKLKDLPLVGNVVIGLSMAIPFIFGNLAFTEVLAPENLILFVMAFTVGLAREMIKTVEDFEGDKKARGAKTLPFYVGKGNTLRLSLLVLVIFVIVTMYSFTIIHFSLVSSGLLILCLVYYIYLIIRLLKLSGAVSEMDKKSFVKIRTQTMITMFIALVALLLTKFGL